METEILAEECREETDGHVVKLEVCTPLASGGGGGGAVGKQWGLAMIVLQPCCDYAPTVASRAQASKHTRIWEAACVANACAYDLRSGGSCGLQSLSVDLCSLCLSLPVFERICVFAYTNGKDC